ncbi:hypothetical protein BC939DRAFT_435999 [Gamsiella multidivaricata]|uniref:uncharacterized protein n=1 Tax=Gamsiella multidivaricata TaxID=101098 RepID=UPI00221ED330|nr:uncharacterized protein BC939DRAFT_435999 [Gamsiella multidivaricata]KAI7831684.1 hypothetical protein BC939DRAFT_435999 [Gamsiella multidivaricata]
MPTQNAYIATMLIFTGTFALQLASLFDPKWVQYKSPEPYYTETNYGLFQKCSTLTDDCRRFPLKKWGDCDHDKGSDRWVNLCLEWRLAAGMSVVAAIVGLWVLAGLGTVLYTGERWRAHGWKHILGLIGIFAALQVVSMAMVAHVMQTSAMFIHHRYGLSFIFSNVSWGLAAALAIGVILFARYGTRGYIALE